LNRLKVKSSVIKNIDYQQDIIYLLSDAKKIPDDCIEKLSLEFLHPNERNLINKRSKILAKKEFLTSRILIKTLIVSLSHYKFDQLDLFFDDDELKLTARVNLKPIPINISLSHSKGMVFIALTKKQIALGVDIEFNNKNRNVKKLAEHFFHPKEFRAVNKLGVSKFYTLWTLKEAASKMLRQPLLSTLGLNTVELIKKYDSKRDKYNNFSLAIISSDKLINNSINLIELEKINRKHDA